MIDFGNKIAEVCLNYFDSLAKHGKPDRKKQWTILASFVQEKDENLTVVALGTGTSCLGFNQLCESGKLVHDSHAEVIARRAFNRYIFEQISNAYDNFGSSAIFVVKEKEGTCRLKDNIKFHFYTTQSPCGDASIYPIGESVSGCLASSGQDNIPAAAGKHKQSNDEYYSNSKKVKLSLKSNQDCLAATGVDEDIKLTDINRTGAKTAPGEKTDPHCQGVNYHEVGLLRTKPGRGVRTHSMSCSDKIMKWTIMGSQGGLTAFFLDQPIYICTFVICGNSTVISAFKRAVGKRVDKVLIKCLLHESRYTFSIPTVIASDIPFKFSKSQQVGALPCGSAISWSRVSENCHEVVAKTGLRLGITSKQKNTTKAACSISRLQLFNCYKRLLLKVSPDSILKRKADVANCKSYSDYKALSTEYFKVWNSVQKCLFPNWVKHDRSLDNF